MTVAGVAEMLLAVVMAGVLAVMIGIPDLAGWAWRKAAALAGRRRRRPGRPAAPDGNAKRKQD